ncbi:hypothetical protein CHS0354_000689 [Potamilus streckersoni]|uniref:NAD-dependent epimerase/dehydratase domain-containing protein n=1 Tax=Potamilus streckersoni TaxID=2493646 RepID=A0AAE0W8I2_9BIVA|nr:hypothetical protein CHS0354_000689 [Potamilus streckersoni]
MNTFIVTTTINTPTRATLAFCKLAKQNQWRFIIAGDTKTPHGLYQILEKRFHPFVTYLSPETQQVLNPKLSDIIGWKSIERRNLGFLYAYLQGADIIATVDDDNIPYNTWGQNILIGQEIEIDLFINTACNFFDPISVTNCNELWHRGFPIDFVPVKNNIEYKGKTMRRVLVQANFWDGDPDIDAICRLSKKPIVKFNDFMPFGSTQLAPFNSQNTFIAREVIPYYAMLPFTGRMDDIWASYIVQHYFPHSVIFCNATVYQDRNVQDLVSNLENEIIGYRKTLALLNDLPNFLNYIPQKNKRILANLARSIQIILNRVTTMKKVLVCGAGGFIGGHLVKRLKAEGYWVRGADIKKHEYSKTQADEFVLGDLCDINVVRKCVDNDMDEIYQLAADMGGAGYVFTKLNDANIMTNSAQINIHIAKESVIKKVGKVFYSSSACMYPEHNQTDPNNPKCSEDSAYPANPDSEYGWEKLFSERLYLAFKRNHKLNVRIARLHNIFGPEGSWNNGKEKAPAAMCRKAAKTPDGGKIEVWRDGNQTRSFLYIDECIEAIRRLMNSNFSEPVNIGSEEMISINHFAQMAIDISKKNLSIKNIYGSEFLKIYGYECPIGVRGRNSDNKLFKENIGWAPSEPLRKGMEKTFAWIDEQVKKSV